jgi:hypothetical protein
MHWGKSTRNRLKKPWKATPNRNATSADIISRHTRLWSNTDALYPKELAEEQEWWKEKVEG